MEVNHYYPFGGIFASTGNVQPYKYNGKVIKEKLEEVLESPYVLEGGPRLIK